MGDDSAGLSGFFPGRPVRLVSGELGRRLDEWLCAPAFVSEHVFRFLEECQATELTEVLRQAREYAEDVQAQAVLTIWSRVYHVPDERLKANDLTHVGLMARIWDTLQASGRERLQAHRGNFYRMIESLIREILPGDGRA